MDEREREGEGGRRAGFGRLVSKEALRQTAMQQPSHFLRRARSIQGGVLSIASEQGSSSVGNARLLDGKHTACRGPAVISLLNLPTIPVRHLWGGGVVAGGRGITGGEGHIMVGPRNGRELKLSVAQHVVVVVGLQTERGEQGMSCGPPTTS
ncbi:hypothetical protein INR49_030251 [Caranx melampygus]|nr:hypothetical protein INR49_030251 [Caranx melampygus]